MVNKEERESEISKAHNQKMLNVDVIRPTERLELGITSSEIFFTFTDSSGKF